jgi:hypothetical protein
LSARHKAVSREPTDLKTLNVTTKGKKNPFFFSYFGAQASHCLLNEMNEWVPDFTAKYKQKIEVERPYSEGPAAT